MTLIHDNLIEMTFYQHPKINRTNNCAVREINGLQNTCKDLLRKVSGYRRSAFFMFAYPTGAPNHGLKLKNYIEKHKLGEVVRTKPRHNPASGNDVNAYMYVPDQRALRKWRQDNR